jgi:long-chain fatty acid transport protein
VLLFLATTAFASGLDVPAIGTGTSGPAMADGASVYFNPANLTRLEGPTIQVIGGAVVGRIGYRRNRLGTYQSPDGLQFTEPVDDAWLAPEKTGEAAPVGATPASPFANLFVGVPLGKTVAIGGGVYIPYAAPLTFPEDGPQRWALQQAFLAFTNATLAVSVAPSDRFHIGAGVTYVNGIGSFARVQDFAGLDVFAEGLSNPPIGQENDFGSTAPTTMRELDVLGRPFALTNGTSHGIDANLGVAFRVGETWFGATYHHGSRVRFRGDFGLDMNDDFFTGDLAAQGLEYPPLVTGDASLSLRLPGRVMLGMDAPLSESVSLEVEAATVLWRQLRSFDLVLESPDLAQPELGIGTSIETAIPRDWQNSVHVELTPRFRTSDAVELLATAGLHTPASPQRTVDVASPDGLRLVGALGGRFAVSDRVALHTDAEVQTILPRTVTESDFDLANGRYTLVLVSAGLGLTWTLR